MIIETAKALSLDQEVLSKLDMTGASVGYKMRYGMGPAYHNGVVQCLKSTKFSLNIDESTASNSQHVFTVLANIYNDERGVIVTEHLRSLSVTKVNSITLFEAVKQVIESDGVPWKNLMSVLMDSCNVMRGSKSGVEVRLREVAPHLLDIDGDTVHHVHNASKRLTQPFDRMVEKFGKALHTDIEWHKDVEESLTEICVIVGTKYTKPPMYSATRWLSVYQVALDVLRQLSAYTLCYFSFLCTSDKVLYDVRNIPIFKKCNLSLESKARIREIQATLASKTLTPEGKERKSKLLQCLFIKRKEFLCTVYFYTATLPMLQKFVKFFQSEVPMIHLLHDKMNELFVDFVSGFLKPEVVKGCSRVTALQVIEDNCLSEKDMYVGSAKNILAALPPLHSLRDDFYGKARKAYIECADYMQRTLPLNNKVLKHLSAVDPLARGSTIALKYLKALPDIVTNVITPGTETDTYHMEVHKYSCDQHLPNPLDASGEPVQIDIWWTQVKSKFPTLFKIVSAVLTCFHGPLVESSFSVMGDLIDKRSGKMNIETYGALQTTKYHLKATNRTAIQSFSRKNVKDDPVNKDMCIHIRAAAGKYKLSLRKAKESRIKRAEELKLQKQKILSKQKEKKRREDAEKAARLKHKKEMVAKLKKLAVNRNNKTARDRETMKLKLKERKEKELSMRINAGKGSCADGSGRGKRR